jgi:hypothetical protein
MARGPVDGGPLHEAETQALIGDDGGSARGLTIHSRSSARNADAFELSERRPNRLLAIVHVVGVADHPKPADDERSSGCERGVETFALHRVPGRRLVEAGFQISEQHVGLPQRVSDASERHPGIDDVHEVDVAGQHQHSSHGSPSTVQAISRESHGSPNAMT